MAVDIGSLFDEEPRKNHQQTERERLLAARDKYSRMVLNSWADKEVASINRQLQRLDENKKSGGFGI